jgi:hypothetical protein
VALLLTSTIDRCELAGEVNPTMFLVTGFLYPAANVKSQTISMQSYAKVNSLKP